jgi:hypothetical protein
MTEAADARGAAYVAG